ncbi:MAG: nicotinate (nicotinamide) nucleotide adenylyltransferase [Clostridia bacterium]|nr:nicotinate (nicotinamide) nucleotide adenylyltransferase [Clostridia bacterium]
MKKRYGFFGGSFNPVTKAHINLANIVINEYHLDKVVFVPMGDYYPKQDLAKEKQRYEMLKIAIKHQKKLEISDIELNLPYSLTMLQAFQRIQQQYNEVEAYFIIGADNIKKLIHLPDFEELAKTYQYIIIERNNDITKNEMYQNPILVRFKTHFNLIKDNPFEQISSTKVRELIQNKQEEEIETMLQQQVYEYIKVNKLYIN